jgi:hypothetical protein
MHAGFCTEKYSHAHMQMHTEEKYSCVCVCIYIYIHTHTYIHTHIHLRSQAEKSLREECQQQVEDAVTLKVQAVLFRAQTEVTLTTNMPCLSLPWSCIQTWSMRIKCIFVWFVVLFLSTPHSRAIMCMAYMYVQTRCFWVWNPSQQKSRCNWITYTIMLCTCICRCATMHARTNLWPCVCSIWISKCTCLAIDMSKYACAKYARMYEHAQVWMLHASDACVCVCVCVCVQSSWLKACIYCAYTAYTAAYIVHLRLHVWFIHEHIVWVGATCDDWRGSWNKYQLCCQAKHVCAELCTFCAHITWIQKVYPYVELVSRMRFFVYAPVCVLQMFVRVFDMHEVCICTSVNMYDCV